MKRILFGLVMLSGLALATAPMASAVGIPNSGPECGSSYAFQVHGTEPNYNGATLPPDPDTANAGPLNYIVGVGQISFGTALSGCAITGEMIYNDNGIFSGFLGAPGACDLGGVSFTGGGIGCFDGNNHFTGGTLTPGISGSGPGRTLSFLAGFTFTNGAPFTPSSIPLTFGLEANTGAGVVVGTSIATNGPNNTPPLIGINGATSAPVLTITMQKQATLAAYSTGGKGYGTAPFLGLSVISCEGYGNDQSDPFAQPAYGSFGSTVGAYQIFSTGFAGGDLNFNSNDNVGTDYSGLGLPSNNLDCPFYSEMTNQVNAGTSTAYADGAYNSIANLPIGSATCFNGFITAEDATSAVAWGATNANSYQIVTSIAAAPAAPLGTGGLLSPDPGEVASCTTYSSVPAGTITNLVVPQTITAINKLATGYVKLTNTSPATCNVTLTMAPSSATVGANTCSLKLVSFPLLLAEPVNALVGGNTASTEYAQTDCTCNGITPAVTTSSTLTLTSSNCPLSGTTSYTITCKN